MKDLLTNEGFLRAWEAVHGQPEPMTEQERADHEASCRAVRAQDEGIDTADLFRRRQAAGECC